MNKFGKDLFAAQTLLPPPAGVAGTGRHTSAPSRQRVCAGGDKPEVGEWQNRPLEKMYPLVFFDALRVRICDEDTVHNKAMYLALGDITAKWKAPPAGWCNAANQFAIQFGARFLILG